MKKQKVAEFDKKTLVNAVNFARKKQLLADDKDWVQWLSVSAGGGGAVLSRGRLHPVAR